MMAAVLAIDGHGNTLHSSLLGSASSKPVLVKLSVSCWLTSAVAGVVVVFRRACINAGAACI